MKILCRYFILSLALLFCVLITSCDKDEESEEPVFHITDVKRHDIAEYGNFVYCANGRIYRFNRVTETFHAACVDPECKGDCPLDCATSFFAGVRDGRVYFIGYQQFTHNVLLAYQDVATGETGVLKTMSDIEEGTGSLSFIEDEYWYYMRKILKSGGNAAEPEDYEDSVCRISLDSSNDEPLFKCEDGEWMRMVGAGKIITEWNGVLYATDIESKEKSELFNLTAHGYTSITGISYLDGRIYCVAGSQETQPVEYTGEKCQMKFLIWMDVRTGETGRVVDNPVTGFCLTNDTIYYLPQKLRYFYVPEDYEEHPEDVVVYTVDETLHACDLNGENTREVYTNEKLSFSSFTVIDGVLCGWMQDYDEETHWWNRQAFFGAIDLETDKIIRPGTSE